MANPLKTAPPPQAGHPARKMQIGESRTFETKDQKTGVVIKTITVLRTSRDYVFDLCDACNEALSNEAHDRGLEWHVDATGSLKLRDRPEWAEGHGKAVKANAERERRDWLHRQKYPVTRGEG